MALRAVPDHPKFFELKLALAAPKGAVLGWLESVWHFCGRFTPHGNLGKYSDEAIETWVEWDGKPGELIKALIDTGWIDKDETHRLLVHDWHLHADNATKMAVKRSLKPFCTVSCVLSPQVVTVSPHNPTVLGLPVPVPVPEPVPVPQAVSPLMVAQGVMHETRLAGWRLQTALEDVIRREQEEPDYDPEKIRIRLADAYGKFCEIKPNLEFAWGAEKFFSEGHWREDPATWKYKPGIEPPRKQKAPPKSLDQQLSEKGHFGERT